MTTDTPPRPPSSRITDPLPEMHHDLFPDLFPDLVTEAAANLAGALQPVSEPAALWEARWREEEMPRLVPILSPVRHNDSSTVSEDSEIDLTPTLIRARRGAWSSQRCWDDAEEE